MTAKQSPATPAERLRAELASADAEAHAAMLNAAREATTEYYRQGGYRMKEFGRAMNALRIALSAGDGA